MKGRSLYQDLVLETFAFRLRAVGWGVSFMISLELSKCGVENVIELYGHAPKFDGTSSLIIINFPDGLRKIFRLLGYMQDSELQPGRCRIAAMITTLKNLIGHSRNISDVVDATIEAGGEKVEELEKVYVRPVPTADFYATDLDNIKGQLGVYFKSSVKRLINNGDIIRLEVDAHAVEKDHKPLLVLLSLAFKGSYGVVDLGRTELVWDAIDFPFNCCLPPKIDLVGPWKMESWNRSLDSIINAQRKLEDCLSSVRDFFSILLRGPAGYFKRKIVADACDKCGIVLHRPEAISKTELQEKIKIIVTFGPSCILIRHENVPIAKRTILREKLSKDPVFLIGISDDRSLKINSEIYDQVIDITKPSYDERLRLFQEATNREFDNPEIIKRTETFSLVELFRLLDNIKANPDSSLLLFNDAQSKRSRWKSSMVTVPRVTWDQVAGLEKAKQLIREIVNNTKSVGSKLGRSHGVLLYGPPGTGKTLLAKAVATEYKMSFMAVKGPELMSPYVGETEANVRSLFSKAREQSPCIIFFDELDSLAAARGQDGDSGGVTDRVVAQLMIEIDGLAESDENVFLIGATNRPDLLDPALLRPGRLDKHVFMGLPVGLDERIAILEAASHRIRDNLAPSVDFERLLVEHASTSLSPADLATLCHRAIQKAICRNIQQIEAAKTTCASSAELVLVHQQDFIDALCTLKR